MSAEFQPWPKTPRIENEKVIFTEKIDGTNACIVVGDGKILLTQSRTRIIQPGDDNFGFAKWAYENEEQIVKDLGPGRWFGEWWGLGIQRGYDLKDRKFSLFYHPCPENFSICNIVPTLPVSSVEEAKMFLVENGSMAAPGYKRPEGAIMYSSLTRTRYKIILDK